jgi:hypothetical protein
MRGTKNYCLFTIATNMLRELENTFGDIWHVSIDGYLDYFSASNSNYVPFFMGDIEFNVRELPKK